MDDKDRQPTTQASDKSVPRLPRSYNFLINLSRKLGTVATKSSLLTEMKGFLNHEITITPPEKLFGSTIPWLAKSKQTVAEPSKARAKQTKDLKKVVAQSHQILMSANTVFPITLFPDSVTVDRTKVTITRRDFFWSSDTLSIRIEDVLNVSVSLGPLFGSLTLASRVMSTIDHFQIRHLWRADAVRLKHIIQGYMIAQHNKIDIAHLSKKELIETILELGHDSN